ncbi:MAG: hypothetical protein ACLT98_14955 [Eggerthellaceae bacterium]
MESSARPITSAACFVEQHLRNFQYLINMGVWPRTWHGVTVLHGCEADVVGLDGSLFGQDIVVQCDITGRDLGVERTLFDRATGDADYVIASVHDGSFAEGASVSQVTDMYVAALEQERVFILATSGRSGLPYDIDTVLTCAKERHKLIEINEHSRWAIAIVCRTIAERCAELGVGVVVSSDAHVAPRIGQFPTVERMLEEIHFPEGSS